MLSLDVCVRLCDEPSGFGAIASDLDVAVIGAGMAELAAVGSIFAFGRN